MAIYIDKYFLQSEPREKVLSYVMRKHFEAVDRLQMLKDAYLAKSGVDDDGRITVPYPRYIVEALLGYYLGEPVRYTLEDDPDRDFSDGKLVRLVDDRLVRVSSLKPDDDITPILAAYSHQTISDVDTELGRNLGIYGESYELLYAGDDASPKSVVCDPRTSFMVRDTDVNHDKLFFVTYTRREDYVTGYDKYIVYVYGPDMVHVYEEASALDDVSFTKIDEYPHYFGEVPAVEYQNNSDRLGDFELQLSMIEAYDDLMTSRVEDKKKFVDSILALYGASLEDGAIEALEETKFVDGLPQDARLEYVQKTLDESSVQVLADGLVDEILRQSFVVDMSDEAFGTASGQALKMKLLTMTMMVKTKIRAFERGLRKRFEMYNHFLMLQGVMGYVSRDAISPIFTISTPVDEAGTVDMVKKLDGIVDREKLLSLLWFIKDPQKAAEKAKQEAAEAKTAYLDAFGITAERTENVGV